jgi:hypothetical protein
MTNEQCEAICKALHSVAAALSWIGMAIIAGVFDMCGASLHH